MSPRNVDPYQTSIRNFGANVPRWRVGVKAKHRLTGRLFEVTSVLASGVMCVMLSAHDGMPMGLPQFLLYEDIY